MKLHVLHCASSVTVREEDTQWTVRLATPPPHCAEHALQSDVNQPTLRQGAAKHDVDVGGWGRLEHSCGTTRHMPRRR